MQEISADMDSESDKSLQRNLHLEKDVYDNLELDCWRKVLSIFNSAKNVSKQYFHCMIARSIPLDDRYYGFMSIHKLELDQFQLSFSVLL